MKIRTSYTFHSKQLLVFVLFQCFGMLQVPEMRFHCSNGLVVLRICAPLEEH